MTTTNTATNPANTTAAPGGFVIEGRENVLLARLIVMRHGVAFEAKTGMLVTRVGGGAIRTAKREFKLPRNAKADAILAVLDAAIAEAQGR
jgi:hypothetical protein